MYEDIRKPKLLKDIPLIIIRCLPTIYYYGKFVGSSIPQKINDLFIGNTQYLAKGIYQLGKTINHGAFLSLSSSVEKLMQLESDNLIKHLEKITIELAQLATNHRDEIRKTLQTIRPALIDLYETSVLKLHTLVVDNNNEPEITAKLSKTLKNFCFYKVENTSSRDRDYSSKQINTDFVIFASTRPAHIHEDVISLKTYHKPGLAIVHIAKDAPLDKQAVRHGSQLLKIGFPVLFKVFTPIRLFTTIDKNYLRYHLEN
jgi:hypothetical protein